MKNLKKSILASLLAFSFTAAAQEKPGIAPLSVEDSLKTFQLPKGYRLEAIVTEPQIAEPVVCVFDGNGRMYVAEMRTYMQDADATGENEPLSRVSWHEDTNGDGRMDRHGVFVDKLVLPRMILPLDDRVLIQESFTLDIYAYRDTDGDGVADEKKIFFAGGPRGGNMEHQPSGLIWSMDNWLYTTYNAYRLRYNHDGTATKESISPNGGQWGLCQDDYGKPWYVNAGGERGPLNFQQPIAYGQFNVNDQFPPGYREVFPLVPIPDVQGGKNRFRPEEKTLNHFTATCGEEIFRGDRLPEDLRGDLLFAEPVGRLIRRSKVEVRDGITYLRNAHPDSEFIRSTDPNFRPVNMANGPDGCLYIVDMYRGIIQQGNWTKKGSYLRGVIDEHGFDKNIGRGRIYRLVHDDFKPAGKPNMLMQSSARLIAYLKHPNGWWRDTAQKLLIVRNDKSVLPALKKLAGKDQDHLARMHALWTLEGLNAVSPEFVRDRMSDSHPQVRRAAIRVSETLIKAGDKNLPNDVIRMAGDSDPDVATQALLTAKFLKFPDHKQLVTDTMVKNQSAGVQAFGKQILTGGTPPPDKLKPEQLAQFRKGEVIYKGLCFACHGADGKGMAVPGLDGVTMAPPFVGSKILSGHRELAIKVLLHGLAGPIDGKTYPAEMVPMASNGDAFIADVLSFVRNSFGNRLGFISEAEVTAVRKAVGERNTPWTFEEVTASVPNVLPDRKRWKLTASHKPRDAKRMTDGDLGSRYTTGKSMAPGMWVQVELPRTTRVAGLILDAASSRSDYPRGYLVELSEDGRNWRQAAKGTGKTARTEIEFDPQPARHLRITQTGKHRLFWSIHELDILSLKPKVFVNAKTAAVKPKSSDFE